MAIPSFNSPITNPFGIGGLGGNSGFDPAFVDIDSDGDLDLFLGYNKPNRSSNVLFLENTGTAAAPSFAAPVANPFGLVDIPYVVTVSGTFTSPSFADIDGDGDLDLFVGDRYSGNLTFFRNDGTQAAPSFAAPTTNPFGLSTVKPNQAPPLDPSFVDIDGDGDLDALVGEKVTAAYFSFRTRARRQPPALLLPSPTPLGYAGVVVPLPSLAITPVRPLPMLMAMATSMLWWGRLMAIYFSLRTQARRQLPALLLPSPTPLG